jgi:murein L,D-transpeptidase YafK
MRSLVVAAIFLALSVTQAHAAAFEKSVTFITVDKAARLLTVWHGQKAMKSYRIALGGNPAGHKIQEGDSRTPEGRYVIDNKNPKSAFYLSLHISYPNRSDIAAARRRRVSPGGNIMIHGTPSALSVNALGMYVDWTAGCIAVSNSDIEELFHAVKLGTPILIRP